MSKKKQKRTHNQTKTSKKTDEKLSLGDLLNKDIVSKLKETQKDIKEEEKRRQELQMEKEREERKLREKNKTFEELLNESSMDWSKYK
ncbi:YqkE family protein [Bacillus timonensis]|nr:YqkE family protein [Bacillus timonensis]